MSNISGLWCNLFRAIEIAKIGNYSISVYFDDKYQKGFEDYRYIKTFCKGWFDNFVDDGDIKVLIRKPENLNCEAFDSIEVIQKRIEKSLKHNVIENSFSPGAEMLIKCAVEKINLSLLQVEKIKQIAHTIAQIDLFKTIEAYHAAESIQYSYIDADIIYNAESGSIHFGDMINIKLGFIDKESIKSAIEYLNNLLVSYNNL